MPIWRTRPVDEQSTLSLQSWQIVELPDGNRHLIGYCVENREGRVSSVVHEFDVNSLRGVTRTGRVYGLMGRPGVDSDAEYVWRRWAGLNSVSTWADITGLVWKEHLSNKKKEAFPAEE